MLLEKSKSLRKKFSAIIGMYDGEINSCLIKKYSSKSFSSFNLAYYFDVNLFGSYYFAKYKDSYSLLIEFCFLHCYSNVCHFLENICAVNNIEQQIKNQMQVNKEILMQISSKFILLRKTGCKNPA